MALPGMSQEDSFIVSLDAGSSSIRALLFDSLGNPVPGFSEQLSYEMTKTADGGVEANADLMATLAIQCLASLHERMRAAGLRPAAVAASAFWHSFLGVGESGQPATPILHLFDTRAAAEAGELSRRLDARALHQRTGCRLHSSYWPAKLLWLSRARPDAFAASARWMSFPEFLYLKLTGEPALSVSMASGSGLWNQRANTYDAELLSVLPITASQLWPVERMDEAQHRLLEPYRSQWPLFDGIPWFPAYGDGACSNVGSGSVASSSFCLMVGTSGAMRAVTGASEVHIPEGLWCYRVDRARSILGGALTNGGDVYAWMRRNLALPRPEETEAALEAAVPGAHGLDLLPFFGGERSPYWRADLRGAIAGLSLATSALDILQASLEAVALSFASIYQLMAASLGVPQCVIASGGALLHSRAWTQMMADALGVPVILTPEKEASARGAALLAAERLGRPLPETPPGETFAPRPEHRDSFARLARRRGALLEKLYPENPLNA